MDKPEADLLKPTVAAKPVDIGPEFARLEQLTRDLNKAKHPAIAVPPNVQVMKEGDYSAPSGADGATTTLADPIFGSPIPKSPGDVVKENLAPVVGNVTQLTTAPATPAVEQIQPSQPPPPPVAAALDLRRVFFTGRSGVGKSWLAAQAGFMEFCIQDPILRVLSDQFENLGASMPVELINLLIAWGEGSITTATPLTVTRLMFMPYAKQAFGEDFGRPGFWAKRLIDEALSCDQPTAITTVTDEKLFTALKEAGFTHVHVMCSNTSLQSRQKRKGANDALATHLDNQVLKALSMARQGDKLKVVWNDVTTAPPSARLYDIGGFLAETKQNQITSIE